MLFPALKLFLCQIFSILFIITTKNQDIILPCWPCQFCTDHRTEITSQFLYLELPQIIQGFYEFLLAGNLRQSWRKVTQCVYFTTHLWTQFLILSLSCLFSTFPLNIRALQVTPFKNQKIIRHLGPFPPEKIHAQPFKLLGIFWNTSKLIKKVFFPLRSPLEPIH